MSRGAQFGVTPWGKAVKDKVVSSGGRLDRGLTLARSKDKVFDTTVVGNVVTTKVKGNSRPYYNVRSEWNPLSEAEKGKVLSLIRSNLLWLGRILNGDLPLELLSALKEAGVELLPRSLADLGTSCNCPDSAGYSFHGARALGAGQVCKHQAALVFMIIAEIDKSAFQLFNLRGINIVQAISGQADNSSATGIRNALLLTEASTSSKTKRSSPSNPNLIVLDASESDEESESESEEHAEDEEIGTTSVKKLLPLTAPKLENQGKFLLSCLPSAPPFCTQVDFKLVMEQYYQHVAKKKTTNLLTKDLDWEKDICKENADGLVPVEVLEQGFRRCSFTLHIDPTFSAEKAKFTVRGETIGNKRVIQVLERVPGSKLNNDALTVSATKLFRLLRKMKDCAAGPSPSYLYFRNLLRVAHWLFLHNLYVPSIIPATTNAHAWRTVFVPFSGQKGHPTEELLKKLAVLYPAECPVQFGTKKLSAEAGTEQALATVLTILVHTTKFTPKSPAGKAPKTITNAIFQGAIFQPLTLRDQGTGAAVQRWFGVLDLLKLDVDVEMVLKDGKQNDYSLGLKFRETAGERQFVSAKHFFANGLTEPAHFSAIKFVASVAGFLPENATRLLSHGKANLTREALEKFLLEQSPALKALGIKLQLPKGMGKIQKPRVVVRARVHEDKDDTLNHELVTNYLSLEDMVEFDASIALGETVVTLEEFEQLVQRGERVLEYKGQYIELSPVEAQNILKQAKERRDELDKGVGVPTPLDLMRASLGKDFQTLTWLGPNAKIHLADLFASEKIGHPKGMNCTLRPYQVTGFEWLIATASKMGGALLADDMGLGKTIQSIAVLHHLKSIGRLSTKTPGLIVAPTSLMANWASEIARFSPGISTNVYVGPNRNSKKKVDVVLTTYATACRDIRKLDALDLSIMIIDEAQYIKNYKTQTAKSIKQLGKKKGLLRLALTGTPVENRLIELHSIFDFILPGWFPKLRAFQEAYAAPIEEENDVEALFALQMLIAPFMMRRLKSELLNELPPKIVNNRYIKLTKEQASLYTAVVDDAMDRMGIAKNKEEGKEDKEMEQTGIVKAEGGGPERKRRRIQAEADAPRFDKIKDVGAEESSDEQLQSGSKKGEILKLISALKQICNHPACYENRGQEYTADYQLSGKCKAIVEELLPEILESGEKVLLFSQYVRMARLLIKVIQDQLMVTPLHFHGGMNQKERKKVLTKFKTDPNQQILILSLRAGGVGLNLTCANHIIHVDRWWNRSVEQQAEDRAFRIGQQKTVIVHRFITSDTFEEKINAMIHAKKHISDMTVTAGESWIGDMNNEALKNLFMIGGNPAAGVQHGVKQEIVKHEPGVKKEIVNHDYGLKHNKAVKHEPRVKNETAIKQEP